MKFKLLGGIFLEFYLTGVCTSTMLLTPTQVNAKENSTATLTCTKTDGILVESQWENSQIVGNANIYLMDGQCRTTLFLNDSELYSGVCNSNGTYSVVLKRIDRSQHGAEWKCKDTYSSLSNTVVVNVNVPATGVVIGQSNSNVDFMTENQSQKLTCTTTACRPDPRVQWFLRDNKTSTLHNMTQFSTNTYFDEGYDLKSVESTLDFKPNRTMNNYHLYCEVRTLSKEADVTSRAIIVKLVYPPAKPTFKIGSKLVSGEVHVIRNSSFQVVCNSDSISSSNYTWTGPGLSDKDGDTIEIKNASVDDEGEYECTVSARLMTSDKSYTDVNNSASFNLTTLYPATVDALEDESVIEGSQLNLSCPVVTGNPSNITVTWSRLSDQKQWKSGLLFIRNVSKFDDTTYICSVVSEMFPTVGSASKVKRNESFQLDVFFQPEMKSFSVTTINSTNGLIVINDTDDVSFICSVEANPSPNLIIKNPWGGHISEAKNSNSVRHTLHNVSYVDAGEYMCTGRNNITRGAPASASLFLIVRCPPRPSSGDTAVVTIETFLHADVTLEFAAHHYLDEPNKTEFHWFKENVSISNDDRKYAIRSSGLHTNLSITNIAPKDLGLYRVSVQNSAGQYVHYFELNITGKPDSPDNLNIINDTLTEKSVTLIWTPGRDGGLQETFVIFYRKRLERVWSDKSVSYTGGTYVTFTLNGLSSNQEYEVRILAKNKEGVSHYSGILLFETKASISKHSEADPSTNTFILVGIGVGALFTIILVVAFVFIVYKRCTNHKSSGCQGVTSGNIDEYPLSVTKEFQSTSAYMNMDGDKEGDIDIYEELTVPDLCTQEQLDSVTQGTCPDFTETDKNELIQETAAVYNNLKII